MKAINVTLMDENNRYETIAIPDIEEDLWVALAVYDRMNGTSYCERHTLIDAEWVEVE